MDKQLTRRGFIEGSGLAALMVIGGPALLAACGATQSAKGSSALRVGLLTDQDTLNVFTSVDAPELFCCVYDKLMVYDAHLMPQLSLAKTKTASADGTTLTYTLQEGAKFHDGTPVTSADVKYSYDLVKKTGLGSAAFFITTLVSTSAPDPNTFVATFSAPPADDPGIFVPIVPQHIWGALDQTKIAAFTNDAMIGSGPFKFVDWKHGQSWTIERNPDYWGTKAGLDSVSWIVFQNEETLALSLRQKEIDLTYPLTATIFAGLRNTANVDAVRYSGIEFVHFGFNLSTNPKSTGNPLLREKVIRQAMAYGTDKNKIVQLVLEGYGTPGTTVIMPAFSEWFLHIPESEQYAYNPELANSILEQAGYKQTSSGIRQSPDGKPLHFRLFASTVIPLLAPAAQLLIPMMKAIGIQMDLTTMSDPSLSNQVFTLIDYDAFVWDWFSTPTPTFMLSVETTGAIGTLSDTYYSNPTYDQLVALEAKTTDFKTRQQLVYEAQQIFYEDAAYIILFYLDALMAHRTDTIAGWLNVPGGVVNNNTAAGLINLKPA